MNITSDRGEKSLMEQTTVYYILLAAAALILILLVWLLVVTLSRGKGDETVRLLQQMQGELERSLQEDVLALGKYQMENQRRQAESDSKNLQDKLLLFENRLATYSQQTARGLEAVRETMERQLYTIREDNNKKLDDMRALVDEKLQKTINDRMNESFRLVNERLEQVYKGLGEMQTLAQGVGDLKKVLSNVKTRGILGEVQLGAILEDILTPDQYDKNVATVPGSRNVVEYAVRLPAEDGSFVYLPIDAKFPGESYAALRDAYDSGTPEEIQTAVRQLLLTVRAEAKDIRDKYICPPYTTEFGILFLPFEGLYAEVVSRGMVETLQRDYRVNLAGPSTMAALLNSLQMSFRTIAIQRRSGEVWQILGAVKTEFDKFADALSMTQSRLEQASSELDKLVGVRTRQIQRKLRGVANLPEEQAASIFPAEETAALPEE